MSKKHKRGVAILMVLLVLTLISALSLSMYELSVNTSKTTQIWVDIAEAKYMAQTGINYFAHLILTANINGEKDPLSQLQSCLLQKKNLGGSSGWFQLDSVEKVEDDYLIKVSGGAFLQEKISALSFSSRYCLEYAFAQGETVVQYEALVGPEYLTQMGFIVEKMKSMEASGEVIKPYTGGRGVVLCDPLDSVPDSIIGAGMTKSILSSEIQKSLETSIDEKINSAIQLSSSQKFPAGFPAVAQTYDSYKAPNLSSGNYSFSNSVSLQNKNVSIGDKESFTYLKALSISIDNKSFLSLGPGSYIASGLNISNQSILTLGDPSGVYFSSFKVDKLALAGKSTLLLGPGIYEFSDLEIRTFSTMILDTTKGPVYLLLKKTKGECSLEGNSRILVFKDQTTSNLNVYDSRADFANQRQPLGPQGQKIGYFFMTFDQEGQMETESSLLGGFATGDGMKLWSGISDLTGAFSELKTNDGIDLSTDSPTSGAFQIWGRGLKQIELESNSILAATMLLRNTSGLSFSAEKSSSFFGAIFCLGGESTFSWTSQFSLYCDPYTKPIPHLIIPNSIYVKYQRQVQ